LLVVEAVVELPLLQEQAVVEAPVGTKQQLFH
jgi:hypothetical protein